MKTYDAAFKIHFEKKMPRHGFRSTSENFENKLSASFFFVQKAFLRTKHIESNFEAAIDIKNQFQIKKLTNFVDSQDVVEKIQLDEKYNDPRIIGIKAQVASIDTNLDTVDFVKVNSLPAVREYLIPI